MLLESYGASANERLHSMALLVPATSCSLLLGNARAAMIQQFRGGPSRLCVD
jgi:hypothetical protein